jgi:glucan 1,3-beta-glucosidase
VCRLVNAFAFWQGQEIGNATATYLDDLMQAYAHIEDRAGSSTGIELWNGETGWPGTGWSAIQPLTLLLTQA